MKTLRTTSLLGAVLALALTQLPSVARAQGCPARSYWPTHEWRSREAQVAIDRADEIEALERYAFELTGEDHERKGLRTNSVIIVQGGDIIYERYARGWRKDKRHIGWSIAKTITSGLAGAALGQGLISLDDSVCAHLDHVPADNCRITLRHLLEFSSGLDWAENHENSVYQTSSVLAMQFGPGRVDMARFTAGHDRFTEPGATYHYSSGDSNLLAGAMGAAIKPRLGAAWPWVLLFDRIGMHHTTFERDNVGTFVAHAMVVATPRDYARYGYLFLNDGCWEGERILPVGWVQDSVTVSQAFRDTVEEDDWTPCGLSWWLNAAIPEKELDQPWPDLPDDAFRAGGHWGQEILVVPSLDAVVVRTGDDRDGSFDVNKLHQLALAVAR